MAGIWKRGKYWRVEIRRIGYPTISLVPETRPARYSLGRAFKPSTFSRIRCTRPNAVSGSSSPINSKIPNRSSSANGRHSSLSTLPLSHCFDAGQRLFHYVLMLDARARIIDRRLHLLAQPFVIGRRIRVRLLHRRRTIRTARTLDLDLIRSPRFERETPRLQPKLADHLKRLEGVPKRTRPTIVRRDQHSRSGHPRLKLDVE